MLLLELHLHPCSVATVFSTMGCSSALRDQRHYSSATNYDEHGYVGFHSGKGSQIVIEKSKRWKKRYHSVLILN